ncbi:MAG: hypothetical protein CL908_14525 [Deltaproteobacteria bacterium]|nr:hypothetical protein [Deltaproteobacteria bacterium]
MRARSLCSLVAIVCLVGLAARGELAQDSPGSATHPAGASASLEPYRPGPLDVPPSIAIPDLPSGAEELLALGFLAALLYGLRASGLARHVHR